MFTDVTSYKSFIRVSGTSLDTVYATYIQSVTAFIQSYCQQRFVRPANPLTEYASPKGVDYIVTRQRPLYTVSSLYYDANALFGQATNAFPAESLQVSGDDYTIKWDSFDVVNSVNYARGGIIYLLNGQGGGRSVIRGDRLTRTLEPAQGTIKLTYVCGFPDNAFPADLVMATMVLTRALELTAKNAGWAPTSEGTKFYNYALSEILNRELQAQSILRTYKGLGLSVV